MADESGHMDPTDGCPGCGALTQRDHADDCETYYGPFAADRDPNPVIIIVEEAGELAAALDGRESDRSWLEPESFQEIRRMLAAMRYPNRPDPQWYTGTEGADWLQPTPRELGQEIKKHWTTCLQHAEKDGTVYVCARPEGHREAATMEGPEAEENDIHMDFNGSVYWDVPTEIHEIQPETTRERWRAWFYHGTLDPRSMGVGAGAVLLMAFIALAAVLVSH